MVIVIINEKGPRLPALWIACSAGPVPRNMLMQPTARSNIQEKM